MMAILLAVLVAGVTAWALYRWLFDDVYELLDCIKFCFTPDIISLLRGQWDRDWWAQLKLLVWLVMTVLMGYGTYVKVLAW